MTTNSPDMLSDDSFVRGVIYRKVSKLIATSGFTLQDQKDLTQEVYVRCIKSLDLFDPKVGHLYPFVCTIVQRHLKNILRDRLVHKRSGKPGVSLSKVVRGEEGGTAELSHMLRDEDQDRRLGRERRLGEEDLNALRMDLGALISQLPPELQDLLERRKTQSIAEIARDTNIPRSTGQFVILAQFLAGIDTFQLTSPKEALSKSAYTLASLASGLLQQTA